MRWLALFAIVVATPLPATAQQPSPVTRPAQIQVTPLMRLTYAEQCVRPGGLIVFQGSGLPAVAGNRKLAVQTNAGLVELAVTTWSPTKIEAKIPADKRLAPGGSYPVGIQDAAGAWVVRSARALVVCAAPLVAPPSVVLQPGVLAPPAARPIQPQPAAPAPTPAAEPAAPKPEAPSPPPAEPAGMPVAEGPPPEAPCPHRLPSPPAYAVTCPLVMIGTGAELPPPRPFVAMRLRTSPLVMNSIGASAPTPPPFSPIRLRLEPLIMTGVGAP